MPSINGSQKRSPDPDRRSDLPDVRGRTDSRPVGIRPCSAWRSWRRLLSPLTAVVNRGHRPWVRPDFNVPRLHQEGCMATLRRRLLFNLVTNQRLEQQVRRSPTLERRAYARPAATSPARPSRTCSASLPASAMEASRPAWTSSGSLSPTPPPPSGSPPTMCSWPRPWPRSRTPGWRSTCPTSAWTSRWTPAGGTWQRSWRRSLRDGASRSAPRTPAEPTRSWRS
jgi:hypothetical protein